MKNRNIKSMRIAIVYDWVDSWGGVERLLHVLHDIFPDAPIFTSSYSKKHATWADSIDIRPSFLQNLPLSIRRNRLASLALFPYVFESFDLSNYDIVISVSSFAAKAVLTKPGQAHIALILTPPRYLWVMPETYMPGGFFKMIGKFALEKLRAYDFIAAQRPDVLISISQTVHKRCQTFYTRDSQVIYPPFDYEYWQKIQEKDMEESFRLQVDQCGRYYLIVSRLEQYKSVDVVIESLRNAPEEKLIVVGAGREYHKLKQHLPPNISFFGRVTDEQLAWLYRHARALIMPQEEDFGYVSLEAQMCGCPVLAYARGGASETVIPELTGRLFLEQSASCIADSLARFHTFPYNKEAILRSMIERSHLFSRDQFVQAVQTVISNYFDHTTA